MAAPAAEQAKPPGLVAAARQLAGRASTLARLELELAQLELKRKAGAFALGIGLTAGVAVVGLYAVGFAFATIAAALTTFLSTWLALLIVTAFLLLLVGLLGLLALRAFKRAGGPLQSIEEAKETTEALKR